MVRPPTDTPELRSLLEAWQQAGGVATWREATGVRLVVRHFQASGGPIGEALLAQAQMAGADLLVMGAYTHNRFVEKAVDGATRDIVASADLPVLLHH